MNEMDDEEFNNLANEMVEESAPIEHLYCGHCGGINDVLPVKFGEEVRYLCLVDRVKILKWI